jgi:hypothetical protein
VPVQALCLVIAAGSCASSPERSSAAGYEAHRHRATDAVDNSHACRRGPARLRRMKSLPIDEPAL